MKKTASGQLDAGVLKTLEVEFRCLKSRACKDHKNVGTYTMDVQERRYVYLETFSI